MENENEIKDILISDEKINWEKTNEILDNIYNAALKMLVEEDKTDKNYKVLKKNGQNIIKFKNNWEFEIPVSEYEKIKDVLETNKHEPKNIGRLMKKFDVEYKVRKLEDKDNLGMCNRCDLIVKIGEGVSVVQNETLYHRECFELDKKFIITEIW